jgi:ribonucleoside-triphosphate reductase
VGYTEDIFSALDIQDDLQTLYTSGTVFHAFLGEKLPDWKAAANLVRKIAENYKLPYYTMSPTYSVCKDHGYLAGEHFTCPICNQKTEVYSRITGYYRPVQNWNDGKTQEFKDRKTYNIGRSHLTHTGPLARPVYMEASAVRQAPAEEAPVLTPVAETPAPAPAPAEEPAKAAVETPVAPELLENILFTTPTCPNCKMAATLLDKAGVPYTKLFAEKNPELVEKYGIKQAPTLVIGADTENFQKFRGVSDIRGYLGELIRKNA